MVPATIYEFREDNLAKKKKKNTLQSRGGLADVGGQHKNKPPPDIPPDTRIIAICGITDYAGAN